MNKIKWNIRKLAALKRAITEARKCGHEDFVFEGYDLYVPYAAYLATWIEKQLKHGK